MFVVTGGVIRQKFSRVKIIGESPHEWPQISLLMAAHILFHFLHDFRVLKQICRWKLISITDPLLWYCDVTQTPIVMSFGPIVMRTFPSGSHASSHRHQADYHSLIIHCVFTGWYVRKPYLYSGNPHTWKDNLYIETKPWLSSCVARWQSHSGCPRTLHPWVHQSHRLHTTRHAQRKAHRIRRRWRIREVFLTNPGYDLQFVCGEYWAELEEGGWYVLCCSMGLLPDTQNCGCACAGNAGNVFPVTAG